MSLINDALKKAQKQRTGEAPSLGSMPSVGGESAHRIAGRRKSGGNPALLYGGGGVLALLLVVGGYFAFRSAPEDRGQKTEDSPIQAATPPPSSASNPQVSGLRSQVSSAPSPVSESPPPAIAQQSTVPPPVSGLRSPASASASAPQVSESPPPAPAVQVPAAPAPKLEPRAIQYIENLKVGGIRASATDSKVLMNDRVYRIGSTVEAEMGLKLVEITSSSLTFEDDRGGRYTRTF
jgi:hypothetical protein